MLGRPRPPAQVRRASPSYSACWSPTPNLYTLHSSQSISQLDTSSKHSHSHSHSPTHSDLARLSDQNTELIQRLEILEEETAVKERAGRRTVVKLEKEIQLLRDELDEARREAATATASPIHCPTTNHQTRTNHGDGGDDHSEDSISVILEYLHCKITQLEDANVEICREQREAGGRLYDAQLEVEEMRRLWSLDMSDSSRRTAIDLESELSIIQPTKCTKDRRKSVVGPGLFDQGPLDFNNTLSLIHSPSQSLSLDVLAPPLGSGIGDFSCTHTNPLPLSQSLNARTASWSRNRSWSWNWSWSWSRWSPILRFSDVFPSLSPSPSPSSPSPSPSASPTTKTTPLPSVVSEAWAWIHLLVVLGAFVWAVVRRGPGGVLEDGGNWENWGGGGGGGNRENGGEGEGDGGDGEGEGEGE
ncbi:hypothetical protein GG344DRAFT_82569 [Lentinula edodes]|nr:hypothetical protein GG344DRAFT_82569 [Lentinula edodes]